MNAISVVKSNSLKEKAMMFNWHIFFKQGRESVEDDVDRSIEVTTPEIMQKNKIKISQLKN